jgi:hypothetical protein
VGWVRGGNFQTEVSGVELLTTKSRRIMKINMLLALGICLAAVAAVTVERPKAQTQTNPNDKRIATGEQSETKNADNPRKHEVVVLHTQENYTYAQTAINASTSGYAGIRVYNSSSSSGAPIFTNLAWAYNGNVVTNEFGQVQQGSNVETTKPVQIGEAIAQLLDAGFKMVNASSLGGEYSPPTMYVFVRD